MQNIDQAGISRAIGAGFHHIADSSALEDVFWQAIEGCRHAGQPQVLSVGDGVLNAEITPLSEASAEYYRVGADEESVTAAIALLESAERPIILAGTGAILGDCRDALIELAQLTGAHLATTLRALHLFRNHRYELGLAGGWTPGPNRESFATCDLVLAVGASMNDYTTDTGHLMPRARVIHCDIDRAVTNGAAVALVGDARATVEALVREWRERDILERPAPPDAAPHDLVVESALALELGHDPSRGLDPRMVYVRLDRALPGDRVVVTDSGRFLGTAASLITARDPRSWLVGNSFGSIGQGLSTAIGAATAHRQRTTVLLTGDGGFMTSSHDLDAVRLNGLDLTIVILNDQLYGSDAKYLTDVGLPLDVISQSLPDIPALAEAFGGYGEVVTSLDQLDAAGQAGRGLRIFDVRVDPMVNVREVTRAWSQASAGHG